MAAVPQEGVNVKSGVSVIICVYTEERWDDILKAIASIRSQTLDAEEIIVVVDYNEALATRIRAADLGVTLVDNSGIKGLSGARNSGISFCRSEYVAFLDDDAAAEQDWLKVLVGHFQNPLVMGVGSWVEPLWTKKKPDWFPAQYLWVVGCSYEGMPLKLAEVRNLFGGSMIIRKSLFSLVGGFDSRLGRDQTRLPLGCEETELCIRARMGVAGAQFLLDPSVEIKHRVNSDRLTFRYFFLRCFAEGVSKYRLTEICGEGVGLSAERRFLPIVLPAALLKEGGCAIKAEGAAILRLWLLFGGFASAAAGFAYAMISSFFRGLATRRTPRRVEG